MGLCNKCSLLVNNNIGTAVKLEGNLLDSIINFVPLPKMILLIPLPVVTQSKTQQQEAYRLHHVFLWIS